MFAVLRFFIIGFLVLSVFYVSLSLYARALRRDRLEAEWEQRPEGSKESFVESGLKLYDQSLRRRLILGVYVVPMLLVGITVYLTNFY